jgi:hypothetical protein
MPNGLLEKGNIDLSKRPVVRNPDGSISTVRSMSFNDKGREILIPTVAADGSRILSNQEAIQQYRQTGQHLGIFSDPQAATNYAIQLHEQQAKQYASPTPSPTPTATPIVMAYPYDTDEEKRRTNATSRLYSPQTTMAPGPAPPVPPPPTPAPNPIPAPTAPTVASAYNQFGAYQAQQPFPPTIYQQAPPAPINAVNQARPYLASEREDLLNQIEGAFYGGGNAPPPPTPTPTPVPRSFPTPVFDYNRHRDLYEFGGALS